MAEPVDTTELHVLTVEATTADCTATLLRLASGVHRRRVEVHSFAFAQDKGRRCRLSIGFSATRQEAETLRRTLRNQVEVVSAGLHSTLDPIR